jgi:hypothetical protein
MKVLKVTAFAVALVACAPLAAFAQSASGNWELTVDTPQGANTLNVALTQTGDQITGTLSSPVGSMPVKGTATNGTVTFAGDIDVQGMALTLTFQGKVTADSFNGTVKFGEFGEGPFTGKKAAAAAAPPAAAAPTPAPAPPAASAAAGPPANVAGTWDVTLSLAGAGDFPMTATLTQAGDKVTGTISSQMGDVAVAGTMTGNSLNLKFSAQTPNGEIPVMMIGTLSGNDFTGKAAIQGLGEADWTAKRSK